ncbi:MAG: anaerobic ribonucleoside-triphosphate reductase [Candidatus Hermodarchaeota archaeon]
MPQDNKSYIKQLMPKVFRTEGDVVDFEPVKIEQSLIKETGLEKEVAGKITELVVRRIISSGIKFLSGPHIREIVCSILSEQHFEEERKLYTRIGMPLMDYEELLEKGFGKEKQKILNPEKIHHKAANQLAEEYALLRILNDEESHSHLYGDIYIHQLNYFDLRPYSQVWDPRLILHLGLPPLKNWNISSRTHPPKSLTDACIQLANWLGIIQSEFSGNQGYDFFTIFLAPYAVNLSYQEIKNDLRRFINAINHFSLISGKSLLKSSIACFPTIIEDLMNLDYIDSQGNKKGVYGDYEEECLKIFNAIIDIYIGGDYNKNPFLLPDHLVYFDLNYLYQVKDSYLKLFEEINQTYNPYLINLSSKWIKDTIIRNISDLYFNHGILQKISLNLPRYAYLSKDEEIFLETLKSYTNLSIEILNKKYDIIQKRLKTNYLPISSGTINGNPLYDLNKQELCLGFIGLNEAIQFLTNYELHENDDAFSLGKKILLELNKFCIEKSNQFNRKYSLIENTSNKLMFRFARLDYKHFPMKNHPKIKMRYKSGENLYYSNSTHFNRNSNLSLKEKIAKQGIFQYIIQNGVIEQISLSKNKSKFQDAQAFQNFLKYTIEKTQIGLLKFIP